MMTIMHFRYARLLAGLFVSGLTCATAASSEEAKRVLTPYEKAPYGPAVRNGSTDVSTAVLKGKRLPSMMLVKLTKGRTDRHSHAFDQEIVVIKGDVRLWEEGMTSDSEILSPGSFWYEASGVVHQNICDSDECVIYVHAYPAMK